VARKLPLLPLAAIADVCRKHGGAVKMLRAGKILGAGIALAFIASCIPFCNVDSECDGGYWCDGEEFCDRRPFAANVLVGLLAGRNNPLKGGVCANREPPCCPEGRDCLGSSFQYVGLELCDEAQMQCKSGDECRTDPECDDGVWCTGVESCVSGFCFNVLARCAYLETCNEEAMRCEETNQGACFRVLDLCPDPDRASELAQITLVLGTSDVPDDVAIFGDNVCHVPESGECDWPEYADCITNNVTCGDLHAGRPEGALSACLNLFAGADCFVHLGGTTSGKAR
jgi:hypothetical protein